MPLRNYSSKLQIYTSLFTRVFLCSAALYTQTSYAESLNPRHYKQDLIKLPHIHAIVPQKFSEQYHEFLIRADLIFQQLADDAGYEIQDPLYLLLSDDVDLHNGFSTEIPFSLIQIDLVASRPDQQIFNGNRDHPRTLVHELAHHISNVRNYGSRKTLENIFGRILPSDVLSILAFYISTPAHITMPTFWHEGYATWVESTYLDPDRVFNGRGSDSITAMYWRIIQNEYGQIPEVGDWQSSYEQWPFGSLPYIYGLAYVRWLAQEYGSEKIWDLIEAQGKQYALKFTNGPHRTGLPGHRTLLAQARSALQKEFENYSQELYANGLADDAFPTLQRLTQEQLLAAAPTWMGNTILSPIYDPYGSSLLFANSQNNSSLKPFRPHGSDLKAYRSPSVYSNGNYLWWNSLDNWEYMRLHIFDGDKNQLYRESTKRIRDAALHPKKSIIAGLENHDGGFQKIHLYEYTLDDSLFGTGKIQLSDAFKTISVQDPENIWYPLLDNANLYYVISSPTGSRLVKNSQDPNITETEELFFRAGRILHPRLNNDQTKIYYCSDESGIAVAYRFDLELKTHERLGSNIAGIFAAVPNEDESKIALLSYDKSGPYISSTPLAALNIRADNQTKDGIVPNTLPWPSPHKKLVTIEDAHENIPNLESSPYRAYKTFRFHFWTPTTLAVPEGSLGISSFFSDVLFDHTLRLNIGAGPYSNDLVGMVDYIYAGLPVDIGFRLRSTERLFSNGITDNLGNEYDYLEYTNRFDVSIGQNMRGREKGLDAFLTFSRLDREADEEHLNKFIQAPGVSPIPRVGHETHIDASLVYSTKKKYPTSFAASEGYSVSLSSGYIDSESHGDGAIGEAQASLSWSPNKRGSHILQAQIRAGTSELDPSVQGDFYAGGALGTGFPRGYNSTVASGQSMSGYGLSYGLPLLRNFSGAGSARYRNRQIVLEMFYETLYLGDEFDNLDKDVNSFGAELRWDVEVLSIPLQPGLGYAVLNRGPDDANFYIIFGASL